MGQNSHISWTDHTMNFWIGCTKVSPACTHCYASNETFTRVQRSKGNELWGPKANRHRTAQTTWNKLLTWNKNYEWLECEECSWRGHLKGMYHDGAYRCPNCKGLFTHPTRQRVFVQSLSDICEIHPQILDSWRDEIAELILQCTNLDFLFLTKHPQNFNELWLERFGGSVPEHVWVGTTVENQEYADKRIPELLKIDANTRFLSCEPLLGPVDLYGINGVYQDDELGVLENGIHWVIVGGESGPKARPMNPEWARSLLAQCQEFDIPFHFKQWGEWTPDGRLAKGNTPIVYSEQFPQPLYKLGKKNTGRELDGKVYNGFPE